MRNENFPRLNWNYSEIKLGFFATQSFQEITTVEWVGLTLSPPPIRQLKYGEILLNTHNILLSKRVKTFERTFSCYISENEG
jgi:hypothetical protein